MKRRDFLTRVAGAAGTSLLGTGAAGGRVVQHPQGRRHAPRRRGPDHSARIGISSWSFHDFFPVTLDPDSTLPETRLVLMDFPEMIADRYKVHNLELVAPHFASLEPMYIEELKGKILRAHSHLINIPVDIPEMAQDGGLSDPDPQVAGAAISAAKKWIDIAKGLGARSVRCDPGKLNPEDLAPTAESYQELAAYGKSKGIAVLIENHGGVGSEHPEELLRLFQAVGGPFIGALPDFGNFPDEATRLEGLPLLFPYARTVCHAKGLEFDANGNETKFDFAKCVEISKHAGYRGVYSIEYEGAGDPYDGVQKVVDELTRYL
ncbi:MAG TPA: sugar phosphate isomerase/epimerase family protein [Terriglobia bacterium]|nr:sugar phosphate isomerase/epimerase family protein [Terriglobia bacterium]